MRAYLVECADGTLYCGSAADLPRRIRQHNGELAGGARYTLPRRPVRLAWAGPDEGAALARQREAAIKALSRREKLSLIRADSTNRLARAKLALERALGEIKAEHGVLVGPGADGRLRLRDPLTRRDEGLPGTFGVDLDDAIRLGATRGLFKEGAWG
jgi:putative endonuclease